MQRTYAVTGAASGIGAATACYLRERGARVVTSDLHDADVIADLATIDGRRALAESVARLSGGRIDAIIANAGGGPAATSIALNFFGAVATLELLRPLLRGSPAPRAVAVSSISSMRAELPGVVDACLRGDEAGAIEAARKATQSGSRAKGNALPREYQTGLDLYGTAKLALQKWCRRAAPAADWGGAGIVLNVIAFGFIDTPAAAYVLNDPASRAGVAAMVPLRGAFPGTADAAAALLAWCTSPENTQMTGQLIFADAGIECLARQKDA